MFAWNCESGVQLTPTLPSDFIRSFSEPDCHKTNCCDLTTKSLLVLLAELRISNAIPFKVASKSPASLTLKYSSPLLGFTLSSPLPEDGSSPIDTCPDELIRTFSVPSPVKNASEPSLVLAPPYVLIVACVYFVPERLPVNFIAPP